MSKQIESQLAQVTAELEVVKREIARLLACPKILHLVETHEAEQHARELAIAQEAERAAERAKADAAFRRSCEHPDGAWKAVRLAPEGPGCTSVPYDLGTLGRGCAAPGSIVKNLRNLDLQGRLKRDRVLAGAVATGAVMVEDVEIERAIRLERSDRAQVR
jgi:hypothetical protein